MQQVRRASRRPPSSPAALSLRDCIGWAALIALAMSTQLLIQPFVWRHWPWDEVLTAWLQLAGQRVVVALSIALAMWIVWRLPTRSMLTRALGLSLAVVVGALAGEFALIAAGSLNAPPDAKAVTLRVFEWCVLSGSIASLFFLWRRTGALQAQAQATELRQVQAERQLAQARLQALRSQIEPHFLFNTLATVRRLQHTEQDRGAQLLAHFLSYLRATLPDLQHVAGTLGQELELVRAYLGVVAVRMDGRLSVALHVPATLMACEFPPLALATLVENAVKHGIGPAPHGGSILVLARRLGPQLELVVADTGVGFSAAGPCGFGIGLANIRARLQTLYGDAGALRLSSNLPHGVSASICLPCVQSGQTA